MFRFVGIIGCKGENDVYICFFRDGMWVNLWGLVFVGRCDLIIKEERVMVLYFIG